MWSIHDPRDPWAFRDTWSGEIRNSYDDLWIIIPIVVLLSLLVLAILLPVLIHRYCKSFCWCESWCGWFESILFVLREVGKEKDEASRERRRRRRQHNWDVETSFPNPNAEYPIIHEQPTGGAFPGGPPGSGYRGGDPRSFPRSTRTSYDRRYIPSGRRHLHHPLGQFPRASSGRPHLSTGRPHMPKVHIPKIHLPKS